MNESKRPPRLALAADVLAVVFLLAGTAAFFTSDLSFRILGVHVSMHTAWRPYLWAILLFGIRNWLVRRPLSFTWPLALFIPRCFSDRGRAIWRRLATDARAPIPLEESALFIGSSATRSSRFGLLVALLLGFSAIVMPLLWPQVQRLRSLPDLGDPLFSIWRLAWISHQLPPESAHPL